MTQKYEAARGPHQSIARTAKIPYWRMIVDQSAFPQATLLEHRYRGNGMTNDPYVVEWLSGDSRNPLNFSMSRKVFITVVMALTSLSVSFSSSAYLSPAALIAEDFNTSQEVSLCVSP